MAIDGRIKLQSKDVDAALYRLRLALPLGGDMTLAMKSIGRIIKTGTQRRFREQQGPDGKRWKPSQRVEREGGQTLRLTGRLQRSYTFQADHASVEIGTNVVYGAIHHFGGMAGRGHRSRIDARPALGVSAGDEVELLATVNDFLGQAWRG